MILYIRSALCGGATDTALKKLRNRLLAINLISLTLVVFVAFSIIFATFYSRTQDEINKTLFSVPRDVALNVLNSQQSAISLDGDGAPGIAIQGEDDLSTIGGPRVPVDYSKTFVANVVNGEATIFSLLNLNNDDYTHAIETVFANGARTGAVNIAIREWRYSLEYNSDGSSSIVFLDIEDTRRSLGELAMSLITIGIIAIGFISLISLLMANRAIRPVEESMTRQRRFVADASHELKTPIAVIAANAEAARDAAFEAGGTATGSDCADCPKDSDISRWIDNIADEASRMNGLIDNLLALAKAEEKKTEYVSFDLIETVCEEADRVEAFLFEKQISFDFELRTPQEEPLIVRSDRAKVQAALSVLLENAVKYTPEGGRVTMTVGRTGAKAGEMTMKGAAAKDGGGTAGAYISVSNTGDYIRPEDIAHIFDRFFRADLSRNSETGGNGIGLSIAKEIARSLSGELYAASEPRADGGAVNTFTLMI